MSSDMTVANTGRRMEISAICMKLTPRLRGAVYKKQWPQAHRPRGIPYSVDQAGA